MANKLPVKPAKAPAKKTAKRAVGQLPTTTLPKGKGVVPAPVVQPHQDLGGTVCLFTNLPLGVPFVFIDLHTGVFARFDAHLYRQINVGRTLIANDMTRGAKVKHLPEKQIAQLMQKLAEDMR